MEHETTNPVDKHAIAFQVQVPGNDSRKTVGYVAVGKIPKVSAAYDNQEITEMVMEIPTFGYSSRIPG